MALRLDPVRLLIADDVGVGKTIEGALVARELLEQGDAKRLCVLCPPHLCDQWRKELDEKFHIQAMIVRTSTLARLERDLPRRDLSVYGYYPYLVVSIDFVKSDRRRHEFLAHCPDLVIVDEAHSAARPRGRGSAEQQQRHELLQKIASDSRRHLLLLTATPHSGIEEGFLSLLGLLQPRFGQLSLQNMAERDRASLARHFVQRRRADVEKWLGADTRFPKRDPLEATYTLTKDYRRLFEDVLAFTRETVKEPGLSQPRQRVRYWAALSLLRSVMSSPAAALQAFSRRQDSRTKANEDAGDDSLRQREVLDPLVEEGTLDIVPEAAIDAGEGEISDRDRRRLREFGRRAESILEQAEDRKIEKAAQLVSELLREGYKPIVYCRFIATAVYVAEQLARRLKETFPDIHTLAVTSETGDDEEREARIAELSDSARRVLVATDCLSEGINLQDQFDAVLHYDLPWNPNRLDQREGRVDRFGQTTPKIPAVLLYGSNNPIDAIVLKVLIRKAREIYRDLGVSVPVPVNSESLIQAVVKAIFEEREPEQLRFDLEGIETIPAVHEEWDRAVKREKESRTRFAQHAIKPDEVAKELEGTDKVLGDPRAVRQFLVDSAARPGFSLEARSNYFILNPANLPDDLRDRKGWKKPHKVVFESPPPKGVDNPLILGRNHPLISALSEHIVAKAFETNPDRKFARCGASYTNLVQQRMAVVLLRVRYQLKGRQNPQLFAEEIVTTGFRRTGQNIRWLAANGEEVLQLLENVNPTGSISQQERMQQVEWALSVLQSAGNDLRSIANERSRELEASHARLRHYTGGDQARAEPYFPDVLGLYVLLPTK
jgi:superfamily II DNA or RNA helicase